jgi:stearoyl-CoA desaturase (delta-9 desaturase)
MFSWQAGVITFLVVWHFLGCAYSLYVHRGLGHRYFTFTPILEHFFRFYLWLCIGFSYHNWMQHWAAKHRKHHRYSDTPDDPNSPRYYTLMQLCDVSHNDPSRANYISPEEVKYYAPDVHTADDWLERNVYNKYRKLGMAIIWLVFVILFGWAGLLLGASIYYLSQFFGIVIGNYLVHKIGFTYAGNRGQDQSKILCPIGIFFGGEEIHSHHHNDASKPYFHRHWWEIDISWVYARVLIFFRLMKLNSRYS